MLRHNLIFFTVFLVFSCSNGEAQNQSMTDDQVIKADITAVKASGSDGNYQFSVTIKSPDTGCDQYADWWEVIDEDGNLLYRRILMHSHVNEIPWRQHRYSWRRC